VRESSPNTWVLWIHASGPARFELSVRDALDQLRVPGRDQPNANVFQLFRRWLRDVGKGKWLLILDNADDVRFLLEPPSSTQQTGSANQRAQNGERCLDYLPTIDHGSMLLTSRTTEAALKIVHTANMIAVATMDEDSALALVEKKLFSDHSRRDVAELAEALEFMPLALSQAAAYINQRAPRCTIQQYLEKLRQTNKSKRSLLDFDGGDLRRDREAKNSIILTWQISFEQIETLRPSAAGLLSLMSFFDRQAIPEGLLCKKDVCQDGEGAATSGTEHGGESGVQCMVSNIDGDSSDGLEDGSDIDAEEKFEEDITMLRSYSFVSITTDVKVFEMHRLVQLGTQRWLMAHGRFERWSSQFIGNLNSAFPSGEYETWATCQPLYPHVKMALELKPKGREAVLTHAALMFRSAWYAYRKGTYADAESMATQSVESRTKELGHDDRETLDSMQILGTVKSHLGLFDEAEILQLQVLKGREAVGSDDHPNTLAGMASLASTYHDQGRLDEAEELHLRVLETKKRVLGEEHHHTLSSMHNLAALYVGQGRFDKAEELQVQVLGMSMMVLGEEHPDTLTVTANLASTYRSQGRLDEAEELSLQVLETNKRVLGEEHHHTLSSMHNLAALYVGQGRSDKAEELQLHVLGMSKRVLGEKHPGTLTYMNNLASTYWSQGRLDEAEELDLQVLETRIRDLGREHPDTLTSMQNLATTYYNLRRLEEAEELYLKTLETEKRVLGEEHPGTLMSMANLSHTLRQLGRRRSSLNLMTSCAAMSLNTLGINHPNTIERCVLTEDWEEENRVEAALLESFAR